MSQADAEITVGDTVRVRFTPKSDDPTVEECAGKLAEVIAVDDLYEIQMLAVDDPETGTPFEMGVVREMLQLV